MKKTPDELFDEYLPYIMQNWNEIQKNEKIKEVMDMNTNTVCQKVKNNYPLVHDEFIQMFVFTHMIILLVYVCTIENDGINTNYDNNWEKITDIIENDNDKNIDNLD